MFGRKETPDEYRARKDREQREYQERQRQRAENQRAWEARQAENERAFQERQRNRDAAKAATERLIREVKFIRHSTDWNDTHKKMQSLMAEWKGAGNAGKDQNDRLWKEFSEARQVFYDARTSFFERRNAEFDKRASKKQSIIDTARKTALVLDKRYDIASERMKKLMAEWKQVGSAGKKESQLWAEFKSIRDKFYAARKQAYEERQADKERRSKDRQKTYEDKRTFNDGSKVTSYRTQVGSRHDKLTGLDKEKLTGKKHGHLWVNTEHKSRGGSEGGR